MTRIARLETVSTCCANFIYGRRLWSSLKADDNVAEIFKNGRASISLGYIGLHETINALLAHKLMSMIMKNCAKKLSRLSATYVKPLMSGKPKQAMVSVYTAHQVKICVTVFAVSIPLNLV